MQENTTKKRIQDLIQEGSKIPLDRWYMTIVAVCWAATVLSCFLGISFTAFGLIEFLTRTRVDVMAGFGAMACACTVVPYVLSRGLEAFGRLRVLEDRIAEIDANRARR